MGSVRVGSEQLEWMPGAPIFGAGATQNGHELVRIKVLSDRRSEGGGVAYLFKFSPPPGKVIKIIANARSDEHAFTLAGGRSTKTGQPLRAPIDYVLNTTGQPHSAFIAEETTAFVVYTGEPDEVTAIELVDSEAAG
ncbi:MAG TPA: hypothetical protein VE397_07075 [Stellaceae bacterium]|jgi:hypothetical protein|nr:hypothetical protein [Stellaceae bacterium]